MDYAQEYLEKIQKELSICKKRTIDDKEWFCIMHNHKVVDRYKLKRDAQWKIDNFVKFPILPI